MNKFWRADKEEIKVVVEGLVAFEFVRPSTYYPFSLFPRTLFQLIRQGEEQEIKEASELTRVCLVGYLFLYRW